MWSTMLCHILQEYFYNFCLFTNFLGWTRKQPIYTCLHRFMNIASILSQKTIYCYIQHII